MAQQRSVFSLLLKLGLGSVMALALPVGAMYVGGGNPLAMLRHGVVGAAQGQSAGDAAQVLVSSGFDNAGISALMGQVGGAPGRTQGAAAAPTQGALVTYNSDRQVSAPQGATVGSLSIAGMLGGGIGAILKWPNGSTFLMREGDLVPGTDARIASISPTEVVIEQRVASPDGGHQLRLVKLANRI